MSIAPDSSPEMASKKRSAEEAGLNEVPAKRLKGHDGFAVEVHERGSDNTSTSGSRNENHTKQDKKEKKDKKDKKEKRESQKDRGEIHDEVKEDVEVERNGTKEAVSKSEKEAKRDREADVPPSAPVDGGDENLEEEVAKSSKKDKKDKKDKKEKKEKKEKRDTIEEVDSQEEVTKTMKKSSKEVAEVEEEDGYNDDNPDYEDDDEPIDGNDDDDDDSGDDTGDDSDICFVMPKKSNTATEGKLGGTNDRVIGDILHSQRKEEKKSRRAAKKSLDKAKKIADIKHYNRLISELGTSKLFGFALQAFTDLQALGLKPNEYTFTNLLNSCVRCYEIDRAREYFGQMEKLGVKPNEVSYTVLIKGLCQHGETGEGLDVVKEMVAKNVQPNIRTWNTLLRGCLRCGSHEVAESAWKLMEEKGVNGDVTSIEYMTRIRAQALDVPGAMALLNKLETILTATKEKQALGMDDPSQGSSDDPVHYHDYVAVNVAGACVAVAFACSVLNDVQSVRRILAKARQVLGTQKAGSDQRGGGRGGGRGGRGGRGGGMNDRGGQGRGRSFNGNNRGPGEEDEEERDSGSVGGTKFGAVLELSVPQFLRIRNRELEGDLQRLDEWVRRVEAQGALMANKDQGLAKLPWRPTGKLTCGLLKAHRVFAWPPSSRQEKGDSNPAANGAAAAPKPKQKKPTGQTQKQSGKGSNGNETKDETESKGKETAVDWPTVFGNTNKVRVEVCSGLGEWICEKAARHKDTNWVALEMRYERVMSIWTRALLAGLTNVAVIWGEARGALKGLFHRRSVAQVYVNYPDPPIWAGSSMRLIDHVFVRAAHRLLVRIEGPNEAFNWTKYMQQQHAKSGKKQQSMGDDEEDEGMGGDNGSNDSNGAQGRPANSDIADGRLTLVTDDAGYAVMMIKELEHASHEGRFKTALADDHKYSTQLPWDYGNSYFNRFWANGNKMRRYMIQYNKQ